MTPIKTPWERRSRVSGLNRLNCLAGVQIPSDRFMAARLHLGRHSIPESYAFRVNVSDM